MQKEGQNFQMENLFMSAKKIKADFESSRNAILRYYRRVSAKSKSTYTETDYWTIENYRFISSLIQELRPQVSTKYLSRLPKRARGGIRIFELSSGSLSDRAYRFNEGQLKKSVAEYQKTTPLKISELWAVPLVLNLILVGKLAEIVANPLEKPSLEEIRTIKSVIVSLLAVDKTDWQKFFEENSLVEKILRRDPAKIYGEMDFKTRDAYRHIIEGLANQSKLNEPEVAAKVVELAKKSHRVGESPRHIGFLLVGRSRDGVERAISYRKNFFDRFLGVIKKKSVATYFIPTAIVSVLIFAFGVSFLTVFGALNFLTATLSVLLLLAPSIVSAETILNFFFTRIYKPQFLFKMDYSRPIAEKNRTIVVLNSILSENPKEPEELAKMLEKNYLSNRDPNIFFGLLLAFCETTDQEGNPTPAENENLKKLKKEIARLNEKYPHTQKAFHLFFRQRVWCEAEDVSLEWERKRGKILEFNRLLRGDKHTSFEEPDAKPEFLKSIKYVITIDHNELLPKSAASRLIAAIAHPLNDAVINEQKNIVESGYGIIQPRVSCLPQMDGRSALSEVTSGNGGWDHYSNTISDVYQDMFHFSLYLGKGIYNVDVLDKVLWERFPENQILSHDHLEGFYCRCGFASDIQIFEDEPSSYLSYFKRLKRWVRGDVQCLPWILGKVRDENHRKVKNPINGVQKWKILDNVISALYLPSLFGIILVGIFSSVSYADFFAYLAFFFIALKVLITFLDFLFTTRLNIAWRKIFFGMGKYFENTIYMVGFNIIFMGHLGIGVAGSILKSAWRMLVTKKKMLQWQAFQHTNIADGNAIFAYFGSFAVYEIVWTVILFYLALSGRILSLEALLTMVWIISPAFAFLFGLSAKHPEDGKLTEAEKNRLLLTTLKTWRYFETVVSEKTNFVPPDHLSEHTRRPISQMTSVTNIGMYLVSLQSAADLFFITTDELVSATEKVFATLEKLDRHEGHFYNWYNVTSLKPMPPRYLSTVDSGNLSAALLATKQTFLNITAEPIVGDVFWHTIWEISKLADRELEKLSVRKPGASIRSSRKKLYEAISETKSQKFNRVSKVYQKLIHLSEILAENKLAESCKEREKEAYGEADFVGYWVEKLNDTICRKIAELEKFYPWITQKYNARDSVFADMDKVKSLEKLGMLLAKARKAKKYNSDEKIMADGVISEIRALQKRSQKIAELSDKISGEMNFQFLYSRQRKLFRIGYDLSKKRYDRGYYDLLASESRLASFVAVAQNKVPLEHWVTLSRPLAAIGGRVAMLSWGGSMFEYLFSQLFLPPVPNSLLAEASKTALNAQIKYSSQRKIPWGISESSYLSKNKGGDWQYSLHGVPYLGIRQSWKNDLVVSPYSSFLALETNPRKTIANLARLSAEGAEGKFGYYESIDYNAGKEKATGGKVVPIFLSHHQSAIMLSVAGYLTGYPNRKRFMANPEVESSIFMLDERVTFPSKLYSALRLAREKVGDSTEKAPPVIVNEKYKNAPLTHLISNGNYKLFITNRGGGFSRFDGIQIGNYRPDPTLDSYGSFFYLSDTKTGEIWSPAYLPSKKDPDFYNADFSENEAMFSETKNGIDTDYRVGLIWDENLEYRRLTVKNNSRQSRTITLAAVCDVVLSPGKEDRSHPAYNRLKINAGVQRDGSVIYRRRISANAPQLFLGVKMIFSKTPKQKSEIFLNRKDFYGRNGNATEPNLLTNPQTQQSKRPDFDWIFGGSSTYKIRPLETITIDLVQISARTEEKVSTLLAKYRETADLSSSISENLPKQILENYLDIETEQQLLSCLLFRRRHAEHLKLADFSEGAASKTKAGIYNDFPIISGRLSADTSKAVLRQLIGFAYSLSVKGLDYNMILITADGDGYFRQTFDNTQKMIEEYYQPKENREVQNNIVVLREHEIAPSEIENIANFSNLHLDLDKGTLASQIESEYKKL